MKNRKQIPYTTHSFEKSSKCGLYGVCFYQPNSLKKYGLTLMCGFYLHIQSD
jgi:hypothetical protein